MFIFDTVYSTSNEAMLVINEDTLPHSESVLLTISNGGVFQVFENNQFSLNESGAIVLPLDSNGVAYVHIGSLIGGAVNVTATIGSESHQLNFEFVKINDPVLYNVFDITPKNGEMVSASNSLTSSVSLEPVNDLLTQKTMIMTVDETCEIIDINTGTSFGTRYEELIQGGKFPPENIKVNTGFSEGFNERRISYSFNQSSKSHDTTFNVYYDSFGIITDIQPATGTSVSVISPTSCLALNHDGSPSDKMLSMKVVEDDAYITNLLGLENLGHEYSGFVGSNGRFPSENNIVVHLGGLSEVTVEFSFLGGNVIYRVKYLAA